MAAAAISCALLAGACHERTVGMSEYQDVGGVPGDEKRRRRAADLMAVTHVQGQTADRNRQLAREPRIVRIVDVAVDRFDRGDR